ncbi:Uncharacterized protein TCM_005934 [Theobroma cacao]|uniref:Uncharacterized protein n=1 Tax=Theobroma cacao TaxID=3641 RepID=A0A061DWI5_THECC|nr:Uncharacterized protein TCM_005934 [Theobroma cacao]
MVFFSLSAIFRCLMPSSRVSDNANGANLAKKSSSSSKRKSSKAPVIVSYFPANPYISRLYSVSRPCFYSSAKQSSKHPLHQFNSFNKLINIHDTHRNVSFLSLGFVELLSAKASSRVSDDAQVASMKKWSSEKTETKVKGAPIVVSYFPVNSYLTRL